MANRKLIWGLVAALFIAAPGFAQVQKGSITVTVVDADGAALPGATVSVEAPDALTRRSAVSDQQGGADLPALDPSGKYSVSVELEGFGPAKAENIGVRSGQNSAVRVALTIAAVTESINVTAEAPVVDVTSAVTGQDITLELTESLPTGRSYQSYLQLVPGVLPSSTGNPASRSGVNFADVGGTIGQSTDNAYYIEGINVTDNNSGTFGANLNTEIIQEQSALTGGLPAEYVGVPGLVSNVITKSGGNQFSGSLNYFFQDDSLSADNKNRPNSVFSTYDAAMTLGGPIVRDKAWFFASYRLLNREEDVTLPSGEFLRTVITDQEQGFAKASWTITQNDLLAVTFLTDPFERDGSTSSGTLNNRTLTREQGGDRVNARYTRVFGNFVLEAAYSDHESDLNDVPADLSTLNTISFRASDAPTIQQEQLGGGGQTTFRTRSNQTYDLMGEWSLDSSLGNHTVKAGVSLNEGESFTNLTLAPAGATYTSIANRYAGLNLSATQAAGLSRVVFNPANTSDFNGFLASINASANRAQFYALLDADGNGTITAAEVGSRLVFNTTAGNPNGHINYSRTLETVTGPNTVKNEATTFFLQDAWQFRRLAINLGVRAETTSFFNAVGRKLYTQDYEYAPRLSVAYDVLGNGRHRASLYYGRYYDSIRTNMTSFAGNVAGAVREEQVFVNNQWLTYRVRGGPSTIDAVFTPSLKVPYTDEILAGYKVDLGSSMSLEATYIKRQTRDIFEDFDLSLYADPAAYGGPVNDPNSLFLGLDYFGLTSFPSGNFFLGTLPDGKRDYDGFEVVFRKRMTNNWQMLASYTHGDAMGNTNSDSNADFGGDDITLDPRAPNMYQRLPGSIDDIFKISGSYLLPWGIETGATYNWNSGAYQSRSIIASGRYLPAPVSAANAFNFAGINTRWVAPDSIGSIENDSYGTLDLRVSYLWNITDALRADLFVDIFNATDEQATIQVEGAVAGAAGIPFGKGVAFVDPRRFFLGARLRF